MDKPILLDLFCKGGGAAKGYQQAGFYVIGVDVEPQPDYCGDEFYQMDAMDALRNMARQRPSMIVAIHASPPCQGYTGWQNITAARGGKNNHPRLIEPVRHRLKEIGLPYVIENVQNAPLVDPLILCGSMFGLWVTRHRKFETNFPVTKPSKCQHSGNELGVYGKLDGRRLYTRKDGTEIRNPSSLEQAQQAMGIDWLPWDALREAIPPAYTKHIGDQLMRALHG